MVDQTGAQLAQQMDSRYSDDSLRGVWGDVLFLSQSEYIVCTFSSQVPRTRVRACTGSHISTHSPRRSSPSLLSCVSFVGVVHATQICRLAFELMQARYVDASFRVKSLDDPYYYGGGRREVLKAWVPYSPPPVRAVPPPCRCRAAAPLLPCPHLASSPALSPLSPRPAPLPALSAPRPDSPP